MAFIGTQGGLLKTIFTSAWGKRLMEPVHPDDPDDVIFLFWA